MRLRYNNLEVGVDRTTICNIEIFNLRIVPMNSSKSFVIGLSGATCGNYLCYICLKFLFLKHFLFCFLGGKSTLTELLRQTFGNHVKTYNQDDYYFDEDYKGHVFLPELNHINWELESAFNNIRYVNLLKCQ